MQLRVADTKTALRFLTSSGLSAILSLLLVYLAYRYIHLAAFVEEVAAMGVSYLIAARLNFKLQNRWVFRQSRQRENGMAFLLFLVVNGLCAIAVGVLAVYFRKLAASHDNLHSLLPIISLVASAALIAPISYLATRWVIGACPSANK